MNKLYVLICAIVLSGCDRLPEMEDYDKADKYCESFKAKVKVGVFSNNLYCQKNLETFNIPEKAYK